VVVTLVLVVVSVRGSPSWCMPRKTVVVVVMLVVSVRRSAMPEGQLGSSIGSINTLPVPKLTTQVVRPRSKVHVDPGGGVTGGCADAEAGRPTAATAATATAAQVTIEVT
jgi:hypothetical protein